jgi:hypothetical protein
VGECVCVVSCWVMGGVVGVCGVYVCCFCVWLCGVGLCL